MTKRAREETPGLPEPPAKRHASESRAPSPAPETPSKPKNLLCTFPGCDKTFSRPSRLAVHERSHTGERPYECTYEGCNKSYIEEKHLQQHVTDIHTGERKHVCDEPGCDSAFSTATRLRRHQSTVHAKDKPGFKCTAHGPCPQTFRKKSALERHVRKDHLRLPPFLCPEPNCTAAYDSAGALRNHKDREHGELKFWCEVCGQDGAAVGFSISSQLQNHMRKEHLNCVFCEFTSSSKHDLARHVEMQHTAKIEAPAEPKRLQCEWVGCGKRFTKRSNLNVHIRSAHEGKRFVCGQVDVRKAEHLAGWDMAEGCGKGFASKSNLEDHVRYVHLKMVRPVNNRGRRGTTAPVDEVSGALDAAKRNLVCPVEGCESKFIRNHDLQRHIETHQKLEALEPAGPEGSHDSGYDTNVDPLQSLVNAEPIYPDGGQLYGNPEPDTASFYPDPTLQYVSPSAQDSRDVDHFAMAMENVEIAQQLTAADNTFTPGWNNAQGSLVEA